MKISKIKSFVFGLAFLGSAAIFSLDGFAQTEQPTDPTFEEPANQLLVQMGH